MLLFLYNEAIQSLSFVVLCATELLIKSYIENKNSIKFSKFIEDIWGRSSVGRALEWHSRGRQFDPDRLHIKLSYGRK